MAKGNALLSMIRDEGRMRYVTLILFAAMSACGGAGGSGSGSDIIPREPIVPIIPDVDPVPTGAATYNGVIGLRFLSPSSGSPVDLDGDLSLQVNFDDKAAAVTGSATGFHQDTATYTGNLLVNTGALDDSDGGLDFVTNINGSLLTGTNNYLVLGQMRGEVLGTGETAATGNVSGQVLERGQPSALSGDFQAARQP